VPIELAIVGGLALGEAVKVLLRLGLRMPTAPKGKHEGRSAPSERLPAALIHSAPEPTAVAAAFARVVCAMAASRVGMACCSPQQAAAGSGCPTGAIDEQSSATTRDSVPSRPQPQPADKLQRTTRSGQWLCGR